MKPKLVCLLLVAVVLAGCKGSDESARNAALFQLSLNRQKWTAEGIHDYSFDYDFTAMVFSPPLHIEVRNDLVTQVTDRSSGAVRPNSGAPTVESLFARVEASIRNANANIIVTYDSQLGFPAKIEEPSDIPDTGSTTAVTNLQRVP